MFLTVTFLTTNRKITQNDLQHNHQSVSSKRGDPFWGAPGAPLAPQRLLNTKNEDKALQK